MTTEDVLSIVRQALDEADLEVSDLTDQEILAVVHKAAGRLGARQLGTLADTVVGFDQSDPTTYGIAPEPDLQLGHILALKTAAMLLRQDYIGKLQRGALGMAWRSGLEEASTISAETAWKQAIKDMDREVEELVAIYRAPNTGVRKQ